MWDRPCSSAALPVRCCSHVLAQDKLHLAATCKLLSLVSLLGVFVRGGSSALSAYLKHPARSSVCTALSAPSWLHFGQLVKQSLQPISHQYCAKGIACASLPAAAWLKPPEHATASTSCFQVEHPPLAGCLLG